MRKNNGENERIKRKYFHYIRTAKRNDKASVVKAAQAIQRFEASISFASYKAFKIDLVVRFRDKLDTELNKATEKRLAKSAIASILAANSDFIVRLAVKLGYKGGSVIPVPTASTWMQRANALPERCAKRPILRRIWFGIRWTQCRARRKCSAVTKL